MVHKITLNEMIDEFKKARDQILDSLFSFLPRNLPEKLEKNDKS